MKRATQNWFQNFGAPPKKICSGGRVKISPNFAIFWLFCPFLKNGARYRQSKNGFVMYGHSCTRWWRNGVLLFSMNYVIRARKHPPSDLFKLAPPPKKIWEGAKFSPNPLGSGAWSRIFLAIVPEKKYPKLVSKFWGSPPKKICRGSKLAQISRFSDLFAHFSKTVRDIANVKRICNLRTFLYQMVKKRYTSVQHELRDPS